MAVDDLQTRLVCKYKDAHIVFNCFIISMLRSKSEVNVPVTTGSRGVALNALRSCVSLWEYAFGKTQGIAANTKKNVGKLPIATKCTQCHQIYLFRVIA